MGYYRLKCYFFVASLGIRSCHKLLLVNCMTRGWAAFYSEGTPFIGEGGGPRLDSPQRGKIRNATEG